MPDAGSAYPEIVDPEADISFRTAVKKNGWDPDSTWYGGYVRYEWDHFRHFATEDRHFYHPGAKVLEFGCNIGATAIVMALMGLDVTATDTDPRFLEIAEANAKRYGVAGTIKFVQFAAREPLPYPECTFDLVVCNSVLEYVPPKQLGRELEQIARVLKPAGILHVMGTSNRLYPREVHSGRWLVNYLPAGLDEWILGPGRRLQRGIWPWAIRNGLPGFGNLDRLDRGRAFLEAKRRSGTSPFKMRVLRILYASAVALGISGGALLPNINIRLAKPRRLRPPRVASLVTP